MPLCPISPPVLSVLTLSPGQSHVFKIGTGLASISTFFTPLAWKEVLLKPAALSLGLFAKLLLTLR